MTDKGMTFQVRKGGSKTVTADRGPRKKKRPLTADRKKEK